MDFARSGFAQFIASGSGRLLRIVAGFALIAAGLARIEGVVGWIVAAIGLLPLGAGLLDICLLSPLLGGPLSGAKIRAQR